MALLNVTEYVKNIGKSVKFIAIDTIAEKNPVITSYITTNQDTVIELMNDIRSLTSMRRLKDRLEGNEYFEAGTEVMANAKKDLKTGKWWNTEKDDMAIAKSMGMDMSELEGFDNGGGETDSDLDNLENMDFDMDDEDEKPNAQTKSIDNAIMNGSQEISQSVLAGSSYVGETVKGASKLAYIQSVRMQQMMTTGFSNMTNCLSAINTFNTQVMKSHFENSTQFFKTTTDLLKEQNAMLKEMVEMQRNLYKEQQKKEVKEGNYSKIVDADGVINLEGLIGNAKKNALNKLDEFGIGPEMLQMIRANMTHPLNLIGQMFVESLMGGKVSAAMGNLNKTIGGIGGTLIGRASSGKLGKGFLGDIMKLLFGISSKNKTSIDTEKYNKGPMQYNGLANRSIIEVIPSYLARIESALTGKPERVYDFNSGKWTTMRKVTQQFLAERAAGRGEPFSDMIDEIGEMVGQVKFKDNAAKDSFRRDFNKVLNYLSSNNGDLSQLLLDSDGKPDKSKLKKLNRQLKLDMNNLKLIVALISQVSVETKMNLAGNIYQAREDENVRSFQIENADFDIRQKLFDNSHGKSSISDYERLGKNGRIDRRSKSIDRSLAESQTSTLGVLKAIFQETALVRAYIQTSFENGMIGGGIGGGSQKNREKRLKKLKEYSETIKQKQSQNAKKLGLVDKEYDKVAQQRYVDNAAYIVKDNFGTAKDASIDNTDPSKFGNVLSSITSLGTKRRKREKDEIDEDSYNEYQGDDLFEKLAKAEGLDEKAEVLSAFMAHLRNKPARILQDIVEKVDESIYRVFYNEPRRTEDGKIVHGFFNNLMFDAKDIFQKIGNEFTNFVIDPAKKTFEKMQNSDLAKNTGKELKRLGSNVFNAVTGSFSRVLGGENNQETPDENGMTKDIYKKYQKMWSNYADIHAKGKNENKRIKNKQKIIKDIAISTEKASKGDLSAFKKMHKLQKEAYEQYKLKFGPDPDIETMIVKDDVQLKSMMSEAGENVDDRVFNEAKFKFASAQNKVNNFNQLQGDFINQFGTGYKTTDTRSAVYKQGGKLRSSLFAGKARGDSYIPKTGLYALSKGEMVVPSTMNPFNPYKTNIEDDEKREKEYLKNVTKNTNIRVEGNYAQGTVSNTTMEKMRRWKENQSTGLFDSIRGGAANMFFMGKGQDDNDKTSGLFSEGFKKIFPNAAASGILGSVAGLVTLGPMGMLAGLTLGVGSSLAQNVTGFNNFLFGKKDEKGNREGGLIGKDVAKWFDKYFPSFKDYATIGGVVGAGLSAITGSPLGIIGGIAVGGAYGLIKRSQQAADNLYGKAKSGIQLPKSISNHLKKHLGKTILSMIGGGIAGGLTFGPFGLVGGIALGASLSYLSSTQAFEDAILGKKNEKGEREGGLVGMIKNVLEPLSKRVLETKDSFDKYLKTEVFEPLKRGIKPLFKLAAFSIADITKALGKQIVRPFKSDMMKLFLNKVPGRFLKSEAGMSLAATLGATAMFGPLAGLYTAAGATMLRSKTGRKIAKTLTSAVPKLIGKLGDKAQARLIKQGRELGMNAKQRLAFMRDKGFGSYNTERLDEHLASADKNDLDAEKTQIDIYKDGKEKVAKKFKEFDGGLSDDLINKFPDIHYKDSRKIVDAVKSMDLSNKEQAEKFKKIVQKATPRFSRAKQEEVMKWALSKNKQYHHLKGANENFEKAAANIRKNFMDRYGVDIDKMGADKISKMFGAELTERKEDEGDKVLENANENTEKITDKLTNTNALLLEILKVMHGEEYSPDEMKRLSELTGVQVNDDDDEEYSKFADEVESSDKQDKAAKSEKFLKMLDRHYSGIYNSKNVNSEQLAKMEDVVDQMRGTHTGLEKDRKFDALHSIERSLKSGASGEDVDKALDIYQELVKNNKIKFIKEINSRIKWLSKNCPFVTVTVEAVSKINEDEWPIIKNILEYTSREKERTLYFTESHPINLNLLANRDATELRHILSRLKQFFKQGINVTLDDLIRSLDLGNSNVIADLKQLHNGEKMTHGTIDPSKEVKEAEEKAKQANENVAKATGTEESVGEEAAEQAVSSIEKDANKMALGGVTVTAEEGETVGTQVLKAEATAKEASKTADKALTTSNNSAPEASSSKEAYEESEKEKKLIETQENIASSLNSISEKLNADDTKEGKEKKKEEESGFFSNLFGGMGKMFSFLSNNLLKGGLMAIAGMTALTAIGEALGIDPETIQNFFSEHLVGGAMAGIATMWGAKKLITTGLKTGAKYAGKAVGWAAGKAWDLTKKGASKVGEAAIKVISGSKEKVMMKGAEVVQDVASKFAPIKNAIIDSMNELGKMVKKMSWFDGKLANIFNKFSKRFMEKIANPVMASKIVTKFAAKMGTTAAAVAFPPALVAEAVIGAGIGFADGVANAKEYWQKDDVSLAERAGAGVIGGIIGAIPVVGWVFDAGDLIALWKMCTSDDKNETSESDEETSKDIDVEKERKEQLDAAKRGNEGKNEKNVKTLDEAVKDPNYAPRNLAGAQALEKKKKEEEDKKRKEESLKDSKSMYSSNPNDYNGQGKYGRGLAGQFNSQIDPNNSMGFNIPGDRSSQSMYDSGCGPVSATNALSALGIGADPKSAAAFALGKGYKEKDGGTKPGFFKDYLGSLGVGTSDISGSNADIKSALGSGTPVILMGRDANGISSNNPYGKGAHYVTATGMDGKGNIIVQDPESNSPNAVYKADNVLSKSSIAIAAGRSKWGRGFRWGRSVSASSDEGKSIPKRIWNALKNHGVSDVAVAAIMGNIYAESAYNPQARNPNGGAFGLCQWLGDRQDNLSAFAAKRGTPMDSPDTQVEFLWAELSGVESEAYNAIKNMEEKDLDLATETFCRKFERCSEDEARSSMGKRIAAARDAYKKKGDVPANVAYNPANYTMKGSASSSSGGIGGFMGQIGSAALKAAKAIYGEDALKMVFGDSNPFGGGDESNSSNSSDGSNGATSRDGTVKKVSFAKNKGSALDYLLEYFKTKDPEAIITSEFNKPREGYNHGGVDIGVNAGVPIPTPVNGKVVDIGNQEGGYGQFIQVEDKKGNLHIFPHYSQLGEGMAVGKEVTKGDIVAYIGSTGHSDGPHLHYEIDPPSNPGAQSHGEHLDPGTYDIGNAPTTFDNSDPNYNDGGYGKYGRGGKLMKRINSNNKAANKLIKKVPKKEKDIPYASEGFMMGKGAQAATAMLQPSTIESQSNFNKNTTIDYNDKFDAIISLLTKIAGALVGAASNTGGSMATTPSMQFGGGVTGVGDSFDKGDISKIMDAMNSLAIKNTDSKMGL